MSGRHFYLDIKHKFTAALNPALCLLCGIPVTHDESLCRHCDACLQRVRHPCRLCGLPNPVAGSVCPSCLHAPPRWDHMIAPLVFADTTRELILQFKFGQQLHHARALLTHLRHEYMRRPVDVLMPVPLHPDKRRERGYNQAHEITRGLSGLLTIRQDTHSLQRVKFTGSQAGLSLNKRRNNLRGAFEFAPTRLYRSVAIIDDIITSGSTMDEICKRLKKGGVERVEVWSLARTLKQRDATS
jgi:ComF family protein